MRKSLMSLISVLPLCLNAASTSFDEGAKLEQNRLRAGGFDLRLEGAGGELSGGREGLALRAPSGEGRVEIRWPAGAETLGFALKRWTGRAPFDLKAVWLDAAGAEAGKAEIAAPGLKEWSEVKLSIPRGAAALRLDCRSDKDGGYLIDDLRSAKAGPLSLAAIRLEQPQIPVLIAKDWNRIADLELELEGSDGALHVDLELAASGPLAALALATADGKILAEARLEGGIARFNGLSPAAAKWRVLGRLAEGAKLSDRVDVSVVKAAAGTPVPVCENQPGRTLRVGYALRQGGQEGVHTYRIPGLATAKDGSIVAVYDIRHKHGGDLPADIDVGVQRSTDGGLTWSPMKVAMDMGEPQRQNGIGDPTILVDPATGRLWVAALWNRFRYGAGKGGLKPEETGQFVLVSSDDHGRTWSKPVNITEQVKKPEWKMFFQGPGMGIAMKDGTLVFPAQNVDAKGTPHAMLIYSKDHGQKWTCTSEAEPSTTEAQVVELSDGSLMLNSRDNRGGVRTVKTTRDLGLTWESHPTHRKALIEPVCQASIIRFERAGKKPLLLFSNPDSKRGRHHMTIKWSEDDGMTWSEKKLLLDQLGSAGYSCLTQIDEKSVGILYEGSQAHLTYEKIDLKEIAGD
ncbi:MAG: Sialidase precursor [Verrucomicrobiota bacterium]|jgi:sialidase-1